MSEGARLPDGYRIERYGSEGGPSAEEVIALWVGEGAFDSETAARRIHDVLLVAVAPGGELAGVITAHLELSRQLRLSFWMPAVFVARAHRRASVARVLTESACEELARQFESGAERRAAGVMVELQHQGLRAHLNGAEQGGFAFIGQTREGQARWARYFPGARVPDAPASGDVDLVERAEPAPRAERDTPTGPVIVVGAPGSGAAELRDALAAGAGTVALDTDRVLADAGVPVGDEGARRAPEGVDRVAAIREALSAASDGGRPVLAGAQDPLRVPFLAAALPDSTFIFCHRDPVEAVPLALARWEAGDSVSAPDLAGWDRPPWSFALTPGWRALRDLGLPDVVAAQWEEATRIAIAELQRLPADRWSIVDHDALALDPEGELARLAAFAELGALDASEPVVVAAAPSDLSDELRGALLRTADTAAVVGTLFPAREKSRDDPGRSPAGAAITHDPPPVRATTTESLTEVLGQLGVSVLLAAPDRNAAVLLRRSGDGVNTHLAAIERPTGIAVGGGRLAIGTPAGVASLRDVPAAATRLPGTQAHDACFVPSGFRQTGDIGLAELARAGGELWLVASRFSCLATLDESHSFVPRWRPPFVSELVAEDRCHLNGVAVAEGEPRWVTALGATNSPRGWHGGLAGGGVVVDVRDGHIVASGLALPHSPRWHRDRLWLLLAREGALVAVDLADGTVETVARVPGFARGLAFRGRLAFVGVSTLRDGEDSTCGVWVVDIERGATVAYAEFGAGIHEVADVQLIDAVYPEIVDAASDAARNSFVLPAG